jgi:ribosomal protein S18 acetylase RimI-like enzyme
MGTVFLRRLSRWQAETEREDIADLYVEAHRDAPGAHPLGREAFLRRFVDHDVQQPGFDMLAAADPALAGCAYGFRVDHGSGWWEAFDGDAPAGFGELAGHRRIFHVADVMVLPHQRHRQLASRLLRELLGRSGATVGLALLLPGNAAALAAYQSWGWSKAGQLTPRGEPPVEAWARRLGR